MIDILEYIDHNYGIFGRHIVDNRKNDIDNKALSSQFYLIFVDNKIYCIDNISVMVDNKRVTSEVQSYILKNVEDVPRSIVTKTANEFGISRQAVHRHLKKLLDSGQLVAEGNTRKIYRLGSVRTLSKHYTISSELEDHIIWSHDFKILFENLPSNIEFICFYGFTEMVNNAIDHSNGNNLWVKIERESDQFRIEVIDDGVGVFENIKSKCQLPDIQHAALELAKGKLTTAPDQHSGQGIFFTSKAFESFSILANKLKLVGNGSSLVIAESSNEIDKGTRVSMSISTHSALEMKDIFDSYAPPQDGFEFNHTTIALSLFGEALVSRSQAKRLVNRFEDFKQVELDFSGIEFLAQGFADQVFRIFKREHPDVKIIYKNANHEVEQMIKRAEQA